MSFKGDLTGRPQITKLPDGRKRIVRQTRLKSAEAQKARIDEVTFKDFGIADREFDSAYLVSQSVSPLTVEGEWHALRQVFEEVPDTLTPLDEPQIGTDSNGRKTVTIDFIIRTSADEEEKEATVGTTKPPGDRFPNHYLSSETRNESDVITRIRRTYVEATQDPVQVGQSQIGTDANDRRTISETWIQLKSAPYVRTEAGTVHGSEEDFVLTGETAGGDEAIRRISRTYTEATATPMQVGGDEVSLDDNGRRVISQLLIQRASADYPDDNAPEVGDIHATSFVFTGERVTSSAAIRRISRRFVEAGDVPVQIGKDRRGRDSNNRITISQTWVQRAAAAYTPTEAGTLLGVGQPYALQQETEGSSEAIRTIQRVFIELTATPVQVGGDSRGKDEDDRTTISQTWVMQAGADYTPTPAGTVLSIGENETDFVLSREQESADKVARTIQRTYVEATGTFTQIGLPDDQTDENGRTVRSRVLIAKRGTEEPAAPIGDEDGQDGFACNSQTVTRNKAVTVIRRSYIEASATAEQVGEDQISVDENGRRHLSRVYVQAASGTYTQGEIGSSVTVSIKVGSAEAANVTFALARESKGGSASVRRISREYIEADGIFTEIGQSDGETDRFGRRTRVRQLVAIAGTAIPTAPIGAVDSQTGFVCDGQTHRQSEAVVILSRTYVEAGATETQIGSDEISLDDDGRHRMQRRFIQTAAGTYTKGTIGSAVTAGGVTYALNGERSSADAAIRQTVRDYVEVDEDEVEVGKPDYGTDEDNRKTIQRTFVKLAGENEDGELVIGTATFDGCVLARKSVIQNAVIARISYSYVEVTALPVQVGKDDRGKDSNDRTVIDQLWVVSASSVYTATNAGTALGEESDFVLESETTSATAAIRQIRRRYVQAEDQFTQVGETQDGIDENDRKTRSRVLVARAGTALPASPIGTDDGQTGFVCTGQEKGGNKAVITLRRSYVEATATPVQVGEDEITVGDDGRMQLSRLLVQAVSAKFERSDVGTDTISIGDGETAITLVLVREVSRGSKSIRQIRQIFMEATDTPVQVGLPTVRTIPGTRTGTPPSLTPAREWTIRYLVAGDSTDANWLDYNAVMPVEDGGPEAYLTDQFISHQGIAFAIITRVYTELPGSYTYTRPINFTFPGLLDEEAQYPPVTRRVQAKITETYYTTEPSPTPLDYEPIKWATVYTQYTPVGGETSLEPPRTYPGYLAGSYGYTATNKTFRGIACSSIIVDAFSTPQNPPATGLQIVQSDVEPWRGGLFKRTDVEVPFP